MEDVSCCIVYNIKNLETASVSIGGAPEGPWHWSKERPVMVGAFWEAGVTVLQLLFFLG